MVKIYILNTVEIDPLRLFNSPFVLDEDKENLKRYTVKKVYDEHLASIYLKRKYIGDYHLNERGKPVSEKIKFNISHSDGLVALAISENEEIGLDVERINHPEKEFIDYVTNEEERDYIKSDKEFYEVWTNKESLLKCVGTGINSRLEEVPGLPLNSLREYKGKSYWSKTFQHEAFIFTLTLETKRDFEIDFSKEVIYD
ncbi:MAG: 4'-phosphopantetheinyl transferase superfamily protein [Bacilli bacterium]|nr:4'-phosphopantetheinyl transferase superfamily protein [Bacilli bacterium]